MVLLNSTDREILSRTQIQPSDAPGEVVGIDAFTGWYFGMRMLEKQVIIHHAPQKNVLVLGGVASGKTSGRGLSALGYAATVPFYKFLNVSISSFQANLMFEFLLSRIEGNKRFEKLVRITRKRPYPEIVLVTGASLGFMTVGFEAQHIRGSEFDEINFDEGGFEPKEATISSLRGRLRGIRPDGTSRMGRLTITTTPTDIPWLYERWLKGRDSNHDGYDPSRYLSLRMTIYDNIYLPKWQIDEIEKDTPAELREQELSAEFPVMVENEFPRDQINAITDMDWLANVEVLSKEEPGFNGYKVIQTPRNGVVHWELPASRDRLYIIAGDPGTNNPPHRNSPTIMVLDVTEKPYQLVYCSWPNGGGKYAPFLASYRYALEKYNPIYKGIDATGTQKAIDELAFKEYGIELNSLNFQKDKYAMINALKIMIQRADIRIPFIKGIRQQLASYKLPDNKIAQDLVCSLMELAHLTRYIEQREDSDTDAGKRSQMRADSRRARARHSYRRR